VHIAVLVPRIVWWLLEFWRTDIGRYKPVIVSPSHANLYVCVFIPGGYVFLHDSCRQTLFA
jgi:hypothetical protein